MLIRVVTVLVPANAQDIGVNVDAGEDLVGDSSTNVDESMAPFGRKGQHGFVCLRRER